MRERHLKRRYGNPLFGADSTVLEQAQVLEAAARDQADREAFEEDLRALAQDIAALPPNVDADTIFALKRRTDDAYERCVCLPGDCAQFKEALRKLGDALMKGLRSAADDPGSRARIEEEEMARRIHYQLLETRLVADLMHPDSPITPPELVPTLLGEDEATVRVVLQLFDTPQLSMIYQQGRDLLTGLDERGHALPAARARLRQVENALVAEAPGSAAN